MRGIVVKHLSKLLACAALSLTISGCAEISRFWAGVSVVAGASVPGYQVVAAAQSFDASELVAAAYLRLPTCTVSSGPACHRPADTPLIKGAFLSGRIARDELKVQLRAACSTQYAANQECTAGIPVASYNTLVAATQTIDSATAVYRAAIGR